MARELDRWSTADLDAEGGDDKIVRQGCDTRGSARQVEPPAAGTQSVFRALPYSSRDSSSISPSSSAWTTSSSAVMGAVSAPSPSFRP